MSKSKKSSSRKPRSRAASGRKFFIKRLWRIFLAACLAAALVVVASHFYEYFTRPQPVSTPKSKTSTPQKKVRTSTPSDCAKQENLQKPYLISLPTIDLTNICIEMIGIGKKAANQLDDPVSMTAFGYLDNARYSALPSQLGNGVYDCHYGTLADGSHPVCWNLHNLQIGDEIIVENGAGQKFYYQVQQNITVHVSQVDMATFIKTYDGAKQGISLMTCAKPYNTATKHHDGRTLVWAKLVKTE